MQCLEGARLVDRQYAYKYHSFRDITPDLRESVCDLNMTLVSYTHMITTSLQSGLPQDQYTARLNQTK